MALQVRLIAADELEAWVGVLHVAFHDNRPVAEDAESETRSALVGGVTTVVSYFRTGSHYLNRSGPYREIFPEVAYCESAYAAAEDADAVVLVTEWNEFKYLNLERLKESMRGDMLFDGRNLYDPEKMREHGIEHTSAEISFLGDPTAFYFYARSRFDSQYYFDWPRHLFL